MLCRILTRGIKGDMKICEKNISLWSLERYKKGKNNYNQGVCLNKNNHLFYTPINCKINKTFANV